MTSVEQLTMRVLFLCMHNSARSQMAEALLRALAGAQFEVFSAGSEPTRVHPLARRVLQEQGLDVSEQRAKSVNEFIYERFDYAITLCAEEVCPVILNAAHRLHWALPDPTAAEGDEEERLQAFRSTRDEIRRRLEKWLEQTARDERLQER